MVKRLPEDAVERRMFDEDVTKLCDGSALQRTAMALEIWSRSAPEQGSYGKNLAIMANECREAADEIERLRAALDEIDARGHDSACPQAMVPSYDCNCHIALVRAATSVECDE